MTKESIKKRIAETGMIDTILYYIAHFFSKLQMHVIGKIILKYGKINPYRIVLKNRTMQDCTDNTKAFFEYLMKNRYNEKYEIIWMVSEKQKFKHLHYKNVKYVTAENKYGWSSCKAYYYGATAGFFFYTNHNADLNRYRCKGQKVINFWHGCGYKSSGKNSQNVSPNSTMSYFDYALVPGPIFIETKSKYWQCPKEKLLPLGYPRYDWMLQNNLLKNEIFEKLFFSIAPKDKVIIWLPTFRKSNLDGYAENKIKMLYPLPAINDANEMVELNSICRNANVILLIKKHPLQTEWLSTKENYSNIFFITDEELKKTDISLYQLLGVCDAMISDYSSAAVDFLLMNRPMAFVLTDFDEYEKARGFIMENPLEYMPGEKIYNFSDLTIFIQNISNGIDLYSENRKKLLPIMHNQTENYCERIANYFKL